MGLQSGRHGECMGQWIQGPVRPPERTLLSPPASADQAVSSHTPLLPSLESSGTWRDRTSVEPRGRAGASSASCSRDSERVWKCCLCRESRFVPSSSSLESPESQSQAVGWGACLQSLPSHHPVIYKPGPDPDPTPTHFRLWKSGVDLGGRKVWACGIVLPGGGGEIRAQKQT